MGFRWPKGGLRNLCMGRHGPARKLGILRRSGLRGPSPKGSAEFGGRLISLRETLRQSLHEYASQRLPALIRQGSRPSPRLNQTIQFLGAFRGEGSPSRKHLVKDDGNRP